MTRTLVGHGRILILILLGIAFLLFLLVFMTSVGQRVGGF